MPHYTLVIQCSEEDQVYTASFPEWEEQAGLIGHTHGTTYAEAVQNGEELLALLVEDMQAEGKPLPIPHILAATS